MSTEKTLIHKRMMDRRRNGDSTWTLCNPEQKFSGEAYSYVNNVFFEWAKTTKLTWSYVTCPDCLGLRYRHTQITTRQEELAKLKITLKEHKEAIDIFEDAVRFFCIHEKKEWTVLQTEALQKVADLKKRWAEK